jgi:hypothetical protein
VPPSERSIVSLPEERACASRSLLKSTTTTSVSMIKYRQPLSPGRRYRSTPGGRFALRQVRTLRWLAVHWFKLARIHSGSLKPMRGFVRRRPPRACKPNLLLAPIERPLVSRSAIHAPMALRFGGLFGGARRAWRHGETTPEGRLKSHACDVATRAPCLTQKGRQRIPLANRSNARSTYPVTLWPLSQVAQSSFGEDS